VNGGRYSSGVLLAGTFEAPIFVAVAVLAPYIYINIFIFPFYHSPHDFRMWATRQGVGIYVKEWGIC